MKIYKISSGTITAYHASYVPNISSFDNNSHFGNLEQAMNKAEMLYEESLQIDEPIQPTIYTVEIKINNMKLKRVPDVGDNAWGLNIRNAQDQGYDGIVYANTFEGEGDSYIVFDPSNILIVNKSLFQPI